jgi:hypothetical protein
MCRVSFWYLIYAPGTRKGSPVMLSQWRADWLRLRLRHFIASLRISPLQGTVRVSIMDRMPLTVSIDTASCRDIRAKIAFKALAIEAFEGSLLLSVLT